MLQLTCNNDHNTLKAVLEYGEEIDGLGPIWEPSKSTDRAKKYDIENAAKKEKETIKNEIKQLRKKNPIMISSQNGYDICTELLYKFGYRIPQHKPEDTGVMEGEQEKSRQEIVMKPPCHEDAVEKLLLYKAYCDSQHLSLALTEYSHEETNNIEDLFEEADSKEKLKTILKDLQQVDPLRRGFDLAEEAEQLFSHVQGFSELKNSYKEIQIELEGFTQGVLTQCSNEDEVRSILEHNPEDWDDNDDDSEEQNWQVAVWEGRKEFVAHPYFQQYVKKRMDVSSKILGKDMSRRVNKWISSDNIVNLLCTPLSVVIFCFYPLVVVADFFRNADILFVSPKVWQERAKKKKAEEIEPCVFRFFRRAIHTKTLSMTVAHALHFIYIALLCYIVLAEKLDPPVVEAPEASVDRKRLRTLGEENKLRKSMKTVFVFTAMLFFDDLLNFYYKRRRYIKSFWNPFSLFNHLLMLTGLVITFHYDTKENSELDRADISGDHPINIGSSLLALGIGLEVFKTVRTLVLFEYLGPIVLCVTAVMKDIIRVVAVYAIVFASFTIAAWSMLKPFQEAYHKSQQNNSTTFTFTFIDDSSVQTFKKLTNAYFWKIVFADDEGGARIKKWGDNDVDFSLQFSHFIISANWGLYQIVMAILMLNVLIAIMNTTYAQAKNTLNPKKKLTVDHQMWERIDVEWKFSKTCYKVKIATYSSLSSYSSYIQTAPDPNFGNCVCRPSSSLQGQRSHLLSTCSTSLLGFLFVCLFFSPHLRNSTSILVGMSSAGNAWDFVAFVATELPGKRTWGRVQLWGRRKNTSCCSRSCSN